MNCRDEDSLRDSPCIGDSEGMLSQKIQSTRDYGSLSSVAQLHALHSCPGHQGQSLTCDPKPPIENALKWSPDDGFSGDSASIRANLPY